ncbi:MAG TPA: extracellular solute-binding protein [Propionibacteriaceae bacterium]|nr:extracellular solute-binding protein [Propionibacteriaceae bacterium]
MKRRTFALGLAGTLAAATTAACGGADAGTGTAPGAQSTPTEPLKFYQSGDINQGGGYAKLAEKYGAQTGITVEVVEIPNADMATKIKNAAQANDFPALARIGSVDPLWKDATVDLKEIATNAKVKMDLAAKDDKGRVYSIPSDVTAVGLFLNKTLWDKAGVKYPTSESGIWTWDEFVAAAKEVQAKAGAKYGLVMDKSSHRLNSFLYEFGSTHWQPDASGNWTTNAATKTALEYFKMLNDDKFMPKAVWLAKDDPNALFKSGQVAAYYSGSWQIADFAKNIKDFQWVSVYAPKQPTRAVNYGNAAAMVVFEGKNSVHAKNFLAWLYKPENYTELMQTSGMFPAVDGITPTYTANKDAFDLYNAEIKASDPIVAKVKGLGLKNEVAGKATDGDPVRDQTVKYLNGEITVDQTITAINDALTKAFK